MKKIMIIALLAITAVSCGSLTFVDPPAPQVFYVELSTDKEFNYIRANEWMIENFRRADDIIQFSDKKSGIVKGRFLLHSGYPESISAIITIIVKDNGAKIVIDADKSEYFRAPEKGTSIYVEGYTISKFKKDSKILFDDFLLRMNEIVDY